MNKEELKLILDCIYDANEHDYVTYKFPKYEGYSYSDMVDELKSFCWNLLE